MTGTSPSIAILGAGPVGLDAALAALDRGYDVTLYEAGDGVGHHVRQWGHVRLFSPWSMNVSPRMRDRLEAGGAEVPEGSECPTGHELVDRVLEPVGALPELAPRIRTGHRVRAVGREGMLKHEGIGSEERSRRPFRILLRDDRGRERVERADLVLDCTGKWGNPNPMGDGGIPAPGEAEAAHRVERRIPDLAAEAGEWSRRTVLLVGGGHSAQTAARDLAGMAEGSPETRLIWALRREEPHWGAVPDDPLPERAALAEAAAELAAGSRRGVEVLTGVAVEAMADEPGGIRVSLRERGGGGRALRVDRVLSLTGAVGDHSLYRSLQVHQCYATEGPMKLAAALLASGGAGGDCLTQESHGAESLRNPEPGFFILGDKSYGRNNTFLLQVGWRQVEEVFQAVGEVAVGAPAS